MDENPKPDTISTIASATVPAYIVLRPITGGWIFAALLLLCFAMAVVVYWWFGFFADSDDDPLATHY